MNGVNGLQEIGLTPFGGVAGEKYYVILTDDRVVERLIEI